MVAKRGLEAIACETSVGRPISALSWAPCCPMDQSSLTVFSFLYLKKLKFQKYMSVLENFKNIPLIGLRQQQ